MQLFGKNLDTDLVVVAEIGVNHEGSVGTAADLALLAHRAGADAIKIQIGQVSSSQPMKRQGANYVLEAWAIYDLMNECNRMGIPYLFASALSTEAVRLCDELFDVIKIASRSIHDIDLLKAVKNTGKPAILSTGNASWNDISAAVNHLGKDVVLLHCVSAYPTPINQANIRSVAWLKQNYDFPIGYSNHVIGPEACYAAVALGACMIEVHVTDDKTREFRDHQLSFEAHELSDLIEKCRRIRLSLGEFSKRPQKCEAA